jgi:hypothetical protein
MTDSNDHLYHCLDVIQADKTISDTTLTIMFVEYAKRVVAEHKPSDWVAVKDGLPTKHGRYEVYRKGCEKQHYETWNGTGWASNNNDITHWRIIKPPKTNWCGKIN